MPEITGSVVQVNALAGAGSTSVTVPADAKAVVAFFEHYDDAPAPGSYMDTLTLGGISLFNEIDQFEPTEQFATDSTGNDEMGIGLGLLTTLPGTGSQTLAWSYSNANDRDEGGAIFLVFLKDLSKDKKFRTIAIGQGNASDPLPSALLRTRSTDLVIALSTVFADRTSDLTGATVLQTLVNRVDYNQHRHDLLVLQGTDGTLTLDQSNAFYSTIAAISFPVVGVERIFSDVFSDAFWTNSFQGSPNRIVASGAGNTDTYLELNPSATTEYVFYQTFGDFGDSMNRITCGCWVEFNTIPGSNQTFFGTSVDSYDFQAIVKSTGEIRLANADGTVFADTGVIASAGVPLWIEMLVDTSANPWVAKLKVGNSTPVSINRAQAATAIGSTNSVFRLGPPSTATLTAFYRLPTYGIPDTVSDFLGPQTFPEFGYKGTVANVTGSSTNNTIDVSTATPIAPSVGDTILFGVHSDDSIKNSVACTGGRATRVTSWVSCPTTDTFGKPTYSVWKAVYDGTGTYEFTWSTSPRGSCLTAIVLSGDQTIQQSVTGTSADGTSVSTSPTIDAIPGNVIVAFNGGFAVDDLPQKWRAPAYPIQTEEFYGMNSIALIEAASAVSVKAKPSGTTATEVMWTLVEVGPNSASVAPAGEAGPTLIRLIGNRQRW